MDALGNNRLYERARERIGGNSGAMLVGTIMILMITGVIGFSFLSVARYEMQAVEREYRELAAFWEAEKALSKALYRMNHEESAENVTGVVHSMNTEAIETRYGPPEALPGGEGYVVTAVALLKETALFKADTLQVCSATVRPAHSSGPLLNFIKARYEPREGADSEPFGDSPLSRTRREPPRIYFTTGDTIGDGTDYILAPELNIAGSPVFGDSVIHNKRRRDFRYGAPGYSMDARFVSMPQYREYDYTFDHVADRIRKQAQVFKSSGRGDVTEIVLDGNVARIRKKSRGATGGAGAYEEIPVGAVRGIYVDGDVEVRGTLRGKLTIGARGNIIITDDLLYMGSDPVTGEPDASGNLLGLIAEYNIQINKPAQKAAADGGILINAAMIAKDGAFETLNYRKGHFGTLRVWGSITEYCMGVHGQIRSTIKRGYTAKVWKYDPLLRSEAPPYWPPLRSADGKMEYRMQSWARKY